MNIEVFEKDITDKLKADLTVDNADIDVVPEKESTFDMPVGKAKLEVFYHDSEWKATEDVATVSQEEKARFGVILYSRNLRGDWGIYDLAKRLKKSLVGYKPTDCNKIRVEKLEYVSRENNLWKYLLIGYAETLLVEDADVEGAGTVTSVTVD